MEAEGMSQAIKERALSLMAEALLRDENELEAAAQAERTPTLTLAAKYAPREGCHFDKGLGAAKKLAAALYGDANPAAARRKYRQMVSRLNAALGTTEVLMAAQRWEEIEFGRVASLCLQRQRKAFLNETLKGKLSAADDETGNRHPDNPARGAARAARCAAREGRQGRQWQGAAAARDRTEVHGRPLDVQGRRHLDGRGQPDARAVGEPAPRRDRDPRGGGGGARGGGA